MMWKIVSMLVMVAGAAFDLYSTKRAVVDNPTKFHEANPAMAFVYRRWGFNGLVVFKGLFIGAIAAVMFKTGAGVFGALFAGVLWGAIGFRNMRIIRKKLGR